MSRTFAISDIHGQQSVWAEVKKYLQPDDKIFFLGDAIDRGPDGFEIMKELLCDKRVTYLMGNHEYMMMNALEEMRYFGGNYGGEKLYLWLSNGGQSTLDSWNFSGQNFSWIRVLKNLPGKTIYVNKNGETILLSHAGYSIDRPTDDLYDLVWDRKHFLYPTENKTIEKVRMVHGHTPTESLIKVFQKNRIAYSRIDDAVIYDNGLKTDIDCGTFFSNTILLLDLDTWDLKTFSI